MVCCRLLELSLIPSVLFTFKEDIIISILETRRIFRKVKYFIQDLHTNEAKPTNLLKINSVTLYLW